MVNGVLPYEDLKDLIKSGGITPPSRVSIREDQIGPASFEPTLGDRVFNTPSSMLPFRGNRLLERLESECLYDFSLSEDENRFLHEGKVFVVNLNERFNLPSGFIGESTGRSSIGRTNTVLRLLTDHHQRYNFIPSGYKGGLALEIFSGSFPIEIRRGLSLNQIKLAYGASSFEDQNINLDEADLKMLHSTHPILYNEKGNPLRLNNRIEKNCLVMSLRLTGESPLVLKAKRNVPTSIDFSRDFSKEENRYAIDDFWVEEPVKNGGIILNPGEFYLMITKERIAVPPGYVTKMIPYDINLADLKTQEADLFNPGHGWATKGFCPVLEVKAFGQPIELRDGYPICRIQFQRLRSDPGKMFI